MSWPGGPGPFVSPPARMYVGVVVFGLIATLVLLGLTLFFFAGYDAPDGKIPLVEHKREFSWPYKVFGTAGTVMAAGFTVGAWRALLRGARADEARRKAVRDAPRAPTGAGQAGGQPSASDGAALDPSGAAHPGSAASHAGAPQRPPRPPPTKPRDEPPAGYN